MFEQTRDVVQCQWIIALASTNKMLAINPSILSRIPVLSVDCRDPFVMTL